MQGQDTRGNAIAIDAFVPLANMFGYINTLRSMSSGRANFTMQFDHYDPVPQQHLDEIQAKLHKPGGGVNPGPYDPISGGLPPHRRKKRRPSWQRKSLNVISRT